MCLVVTQNDTQFVFLSETLKHYTYLREPPLCLTRTDKFLLIQVFQQFQYFLQRHLLRLLFLWAFLSFLSTIARFVISIVHIGNASYLVAVNNIIATDVITCFLRCIMIYLAEHLPEVKECLFCIFGGYVVYILQRHKSRGILTYYVAQHLCLILRLNIVGISGFQPKFFVLLAYGSFPCHADIYPVAYAALHIENEVGIILLLNIFIKPLDVWLAGCHILVVAGNKLRLFLRVELRDDHVTILLESQVNVLGIDIPPRAVYHMTFSLVLAGAVHAADGLYGINVFYLLVKEERV